MATLGATGGIEGEDDASLRDILIRNFVSCSICLGEFDEPTCLPCQHTFCKECLRSILKDGGAPGIKFKCPLCQLETELPKDGLDGFKHNFFIAGLQDTVLQPPKKRKCGACAIAASSLKAVDVDASSKCVTCHEYLCDTCATYHCRTKLTKDHKIFTLEQVQSKEHRKEIQEFQTTFCVVHEDEAIRYYCVKCRHPICRDCKILTHDDHRCISLAAATEMLKPVILSKLDQMKKVSEEKEEEMIEVGQMLAELKTNKSDTEDDIRQWCTHLRDLVDQRERELLEKIDQETHSQEKALLMTKENQKSALANIKSTMDFVQGTLHCVSPGEFLMLRQQLNQRMDNQMSPAANDEHVVIEQPVKFQLQKCPGIEARLSTCGEDGLADILEVRLHKHDSQQHVNTEEERDQQAAKKQPAEPEITLPDPHGLVAPENVSMGEKTYAEIYLDLSEAPLLSTKTEAQSLETRSSTLLKPTAELVFQFPTDCKFPGAIAVSEEGEYLIPDFDYHSPKVCIYSQSGKFQKRIICDKFDGFREMCSIQGICHLSNGRSLLADYNNQELIVKSKNWKLATVKYVESPCGIAVNSKGEIAVAQTDLKCVALFAIEASGKVTKTGLVRPKDFPSPFCLAYTSNDSLVVGHVDHGRVDLLSPSGQPLWQYEGPEGDACLKKPQSICVDKHDNVIIADRVKNRIQIVSSGGEFLQYYIAPRLNHPWGLAINKSGHLLVGFYGGTVKEFKYLE